MAILRLCDCFTSERSEDVARYLNSIASSFTFNLINTLLLLQWHQVYSLLSSDADKAREQLLNRNTMMKNHIVIIGVICLLAAYCSTVAILEVL